MPKRSYLNSHPDRYDLIQISLIDTWAATASGGLALTENKLYTTNAWNDFLDRLNDHGLLVVSRWWPDTYRLFSVASSMLQARDPSGKPRRHILAATLNGIVTVIINKSPFTKEEISQFEKTCAALHFVPLLTPEMAGDKITELLASGDADEHFFQTFPFDITPSTDDRPFFFNMIRPSSLLSTEGAFSLSNFALSNDEPASAAPTRHTLRCNAAALILFYLFIITLVASSVYVVFPLIGIYKTNPLPLRDIGPYMLYFASIGLGFMLIEVSQMQRLMIFLGDPVYGLSVVLFVLLLSSGIGSYAYQRLGRDAPTRALPFLLCAVLLATGLLTPLVAEFLKYTGTTTRILGSALLIAPMGLMMGMMFPVGVAAAEQKHGILLPWYWGINGAASVFGSVVAVILSLQFGISATYWAGVACYGMCAVAIVSIAGKKYRSSGLTMTPSR